MNFYIFILLIGTIIVNIKIINYFLNSYLRINITNINMYINSSKVIQIFLKILEGKKMLVKVAKLFIP